jgi:hypothetical protein
MVEYTQLGPDLASFDANPDGSLTAHFDDAADALRCLGGLVGRVEVMERKGASPGTVAHQGGRELHALRDALLKRAQAPRSLLERATMAAVGLAAPDVGGRFADPDEVREVKLSMLGAEDEGRIVEAIEAKAVTAELSRWAARVLPAPVPVDPTTRPRYPAVDAYERERFRRMLAGEE